MMLDDDIKSLIFNLIAQHDGEWYWYQIERASTKRSVVGDINSLEYINALVGEGLVEIRQSFEEASSRYWLTSKGAKYYKNQNARELVRSFKSEN